MGLEVLTEQFLASPAIEAVEQQVSHESVRLYEMCCSPVAAELRVVGRNSVADLEALHIVRKCWACSVIWAICHLFSKAPTDNLADGLVSGNQREFGDEFTLVYVQIGTADTAGLQNDLLLRAGEG